MSPHLGFTLLGILVIATVTALIGKDTPQNHLRRFAHHTTAGVTWVWLSAWTMHFLHG